METVRNYIESLFGTLPATREVRQAKEHLLEMAEDKYSDFKNEGMSDHEAAGRVIAELGTVEELRAELHLPKDISHLDTGVEVMKADTLKQMANDYMTSGLLKAGGITCIVGTLLWPSMLISSQSAAIMMLVTMTAGIIMFILRKSYTEKWRAMNFSHVVLEAHALDGIKKEWETRQKLVVSLKCGAAIAAMICLMPVFLDHILFNAGVIDFFLALAIFMYFAASGIEHAYLSVLSLSPANTANRVNRPVGNKVTYDNKTLDLIMKIYWPIVIFFGLFFGILSNAFRATILGVVIAGFVYYLIRETAGKRM